MLPASGYSKPDKKLAIAHSADRYFVGIFGRSLYKACTSAAVASTALNVHQRNSAGTEDDSAVIVFSQSSLPGAENMIKIGVIAVVTDIASFLALSPCGFKLTVFQQV